MAQDNNVIDLFGQALPTPREVAERQVGAARSTGEAIGRRLRQVMMDRGLLDPDPEQQRAARMREFAGALSQKAQELGVTENPEDFADLAFTMAQEADMPDVAARALQFKLAKQARDRTARLQEAQIKAEEAKALGGGESPFAKISAKDYTNASIREFMQTGDQSVLQPRTTPEEADKALDKTLERANVLRDEFVQQAKPFVQVRDSHGRIKASAKDPSAAGDLSIVFNYMKMLDPDSVVRESEFATAQNSAGVPERIRALYNRTLNGERLSEATRADFVDRSNRLYARQLESHKALEKQYSSLAERSKVNPNLVLLDYRLTDMPGEDKPAAKGGVKEGATATNPKTGEKIIFKGGKWQPMR